MKEFLYSIHIWLLNKLSINYEKEIAKDDILSLHYMAQNFRLDFWILKLMKIIALSLEIR